MLDGWSNNCNLESKYIDKLIKHGLTFSWLMQQLTNFSGIYHILSTTLYKFNIPDHQTIEKTQKFVTILLEQAFTASKQYLNLLPYVRYKTYDIKQKIAFALWMEFFPSTTFLPKAKKVKGMVRNDVSGGQELGQEAEGP